MAQTVAPARESLVLEARLMDEFYVDDCVHRLAARACLWPGAILWDLRTLSPNVQKFMRATILHSSQLDHLFFNMMT
jgi:hypothetical protein